MTVIVVLCESRKEFLSRMFGSPSLTTLSPLYPAAQFSVAEKAYIARLLQYKEKIHQNRAVFWDKYSLSLLP
jgi:hypothetical protein